MLSTVAAVAYAYYDVELEWIRVDEVVTRKTLSAVIKRTRYIVSSSCIEQCDWQQNDCQITVMSQPARN